jgi:hypothetical protein
MMRRLTARRSLLAVVTLAASASLLVVVPPARAAVIAPPVTTVLPDPGDPGPLAVTMTSYDDGATAFTPPGFGHAVEVTARVYYPTGLPGGPYPFVVLLHGRHSTCYQGSTEFLEWPCTGGRQPIPSYQGYDYLGTNLASHGYVVASISANGINAFDNNAGDLGAQARGQLIQHHLDKWQVFTTTGGPPFGTQFVGEVDLDKIGTMGHSRGGEGVVRHFLINAAAGSPYGIKAVLPLAPVDFSRPVINGVPLDVILPYCDGDVNDLQGVHFYDDARYNVPGDTAPKHTLLAMGANHNFFNTIWTPGGWPAGAIDDWVFSGGNDPQCGTQAGSQRLTAAEQRAVGLAYMAGFFRLYLGGETDLAPYFDGSNTQPASVGTADLHAAYHAPDTPASRRDVNRFLAAASLTTNQLGGAVSQTGLTPHNLCGGENPQPAQCITSASTTQQPHTTPSFLSNKRGLSQLRTGWLDTTASFSNAIPAGSADVSGYAALSFRVSLNFADARNPMAQSSDFTVELVDGTGASHVESVSAHSDALFYPPGDRSSFVVPKVVLNTVRVPLASFAGIDLHDVRGIRMLFNRATTGAVLLTDLAFVDGSSVPPDATLSISDVRRTEGSSGGVQRFTVSVTLSSALPDVVTVAVATGDRAAEAPDDYTPLSTVLKFQPGTTVRKVTVDVIADTLPERDERFAIRLSASTGADIADLLAIATIIDDD